MKIPCNCLHIVILLMALGISAPSGYSQPEPFWNMDSLRASVKTLLQRYEFLHNRLNSEADPDLEKAFIQLFPNPRILVVGDFTTDSPVRRISIQDYVNTLIESHPQGVKAELLIESVRLGKPRFDRNNRYIIKTRIDQVKTVWISGKEHRYRSRVYFLVAFNHTDQHNTDFIIFGIEPTPATSNSIGLDFSPSRATFTNSDLARDLRFELKSDWNYRIGVSYAHFFNSQWGVAFSPNFRTLSGSLQLDHFDAFEGFDPNMKNIVFSNRIWMAGCPVLLLFRTPLGAKGSVHAGVGALPEIRIFESQQVTAESTKNGLTLGNVISDADWVEKMNRMSLSLVANAGFSYKIAQYAELTTGVAYYQGMTSLDHNVQARYDAGKYTGQFNPLWGADAKTLYREFALTVGLLLTIHKLTIK